MARFSLNLALRNTDDVKMLIHGGPGGGKTRLQADALYTESQGGAAVAYVNVGDQNGYITLSAYEYPENVRLESVDTYNDFIECMRDYQGSGLQFLAVDSVRDVFRLSVRNTTGSDRIPKVGQRDNEWTQIYFDFELALSEMRSAARRVLATCTSDRSVDQLTGQTNITPDLGGRQAAGVAQYFDFVGYVDASSSFGKIKRRLSFQPMNISISKDTEFSVVTRQRVARQIGESIALIEGHGNWSNILGIINDHLQPGSVEQQASEVAAPAKKWGKK